MFRAGLLIAALALSASPAAAQITTYVAPPRAPAPTAEMIATRDSISRDSAQRVAMTNMKVWVDSAAGIVVPEHVGDSTVIDTLRPVNSFENGSVAPATASALPMLALVGGVIFLTGVAIISQRSRG